MSTQNTEAYLAIADYLSQPTALPTEAQPAVVFGRADERVAQAAGRIAQANLADVLVITGGIGKDSGDIVSRGYKSEAEYLDSVLVTDAKTKGYALPSIVLETKAKHGGENAEFSTNILSERGFALSALTAVAHDTSLLRLSETLRLKVRQSSGVDPVINRVASGYRSDFDPEKPKDRDEAALELLRLHSWPEMGLLPERRPDLPDELVRFALSQGYSVPGGKPKNFY